jgi:hypothetical protein
MTAEDFVKNFLPQYEEKEGKILYRCKYMDLSDHEKASLLKKELIMYHFSEALDNFIDEICMMQRYMFKTELETCGVFNNLDDDLFAKHMLLDKMVDGKQPNIDEILKIKAKTRIK